MKTFFNVLYRRVLYKIPLKFLLILLAVVSVFIACFSNAYFECDKSYISSMHVNNNQTWSQNLGNGFADVGGDIFCMVGTETSFSVSEQCDGNYDITVGVREAYCITAAESTSNLCFRSNGVGIFGRYWFDTSCLTQPYTSLVCQTKYNLIPISEVDQSYCVNNNLCPSGGTPGDCPNVGVSNVFINDIFHPGAFNIIINIPEEIDWDYAYTNSGNNLNLDVVGYNVDYTKLQEVINLQNYKPSEEDFSQIIGLLAPYTKIIVFFVFLFLVWAWIKKPFKSKKL